jgi:hypothetical protein
MGQSGSPASNVVYDLVSIQYHALKGAQVYDQFINDAQGNDQVRQFFEQVKAEDAKRAQQCHELLTQLTKDGGIGGDAYPTESTTGQTVNA